MVLPKINIVTFVMERLAKFKKKFVKFALRLLNKITLEEVTKKLSGYKYIILTEHIPMGDFTPNKDIISGQGIRLKQNSGVNILEAPFNFKIKNQNILNEHVLENNKGRIVTILYQVF